MNDSPPAKPFKKIIAIIWLCISLASLTFVGITLSQGKSVNYNITDIFPGKQDNPAIDIAKKQLEQAYSNKIVLMLRSSNADALHQEAQALKNTLATFPFVSFSQQMSASDGQTFFRYMQQHRAGLLRARDRNYLIHGDYTSLKKRALETIYSPFSPVRVQSLQSDRFLLFYRFINGIGQDLFSGSGQEMDGYTSYEQQGVYSAIFSLELNGDAFAADAQATIKQSITQLEAQIQTNDVQLFRSGVVFYAIAGADGVKQDMFRVSALSILFILLVFLYCFRSLFPLLHAVLVISNAMAFGFACTVFIFKEVHIFALSFGLSVMGLAIDYCFHIFCKKEPGESNDSAIKKSRVH